MDLRACRPGYRSGTTAEWFEIFADHGIPASPVYDTAEVRDDEHVARRDMVDTVCAGDEPFDVLKHPAEFSSFDAEIQGDVPCLGEDTEDVLEGAGYAEETMADLISAGVVPTPESD